MSERGGMGIKSERRSAHNELIFCYFLRDSDESSTVLLKDYGFYCNYRFYAIMALILLK